MTAVRWERGALQQLLALGHRDAKQATRVSEAVYGFAENRRGNVRKLQGEADRWRLRVGDWRVIFELDGEGMHVIEVIVPQGCIPLGNTEAPASGTLPPFAGRKTVAFKDLIYHVDDHVALITLNKPEKLNAMTWGSWAELETVIAQAEEDDDVRCIVVTGAGRGFCAGTDLTTTETEADWHPRPFSGREEQTRSRYLVMEQIYRCRKPTIAAVNGASTGAGFSLALSVDIRIASEAARFSAIFVKRAIVADTGCTWFLPRIVGMENALKMLYTGRLVPADEALAMGLVSEVVPADQLMERAMGLAREIAHGPSVAIELNKRLAYEAFDTDLATQIEHEQMLQGITQRTEDAKEGRLSFLEKREPRFQGR